MNKVDSLMGRALRIYNDLNLNNSVRESRKKELSELELQIQSLLLSEPIEPLSILINHRAKKHVSSSKLAFCFSNFPLKLNISEENEGVSAFDMIDTISDFIFCAQRYVQQKVLGIFDKETFGPVLIHSYISRASSADIFLCRRENGIYQRQLYLPIVSMSEDWNSKQPDEGLIHDKFFINHRLFEVSNTKEKKFIYFARNSGIQWGRNEYKVYFGDILIHEIDSFRFLPQKF